MTHVGMTGIPPGSHLHTKVAGPRPFTTAGYENLNWGSQNREISMIAMIIDYARPKLCGCEPWP